MGIYNLFCNKLFIWLNVGFCMAKRIGNVRSIALERINTLFSEASSEFKNHPERSHRYVKIVLRLVAKAGLRIPRKFRSNYCRKCKIYLSSGVNSKVRTRNGKLIVFCSKCKNYRRMLLKPRV